MLSGAGQPTDELKPQTEIGNRFRILVADDDRGIRETLDEVLQNRGFDTVLAKDGGEAVEIVQVQMVHLVLFDMHMPRLTGLEALNLVRQTLHKLVPALLMTADATSELMKQAMQAQVYSVIPKPVNKNLVLLTLAKALEQVYGKPPATQLTNQPEPKLGEPTDEDRALERKDRGGASGGG
jgi:CheY-like chemotaxis protein